MRVRIFNEDGTPFTEGPIDLAEAFPDVADREDAAETLAMTGEAMIGGGAAPMFRFVAEVAP